MNIVAIAAGLASAFFWGAGDFAGGLAGRRASAVRVVLASQLLGMLPLIGLGLVLRQPWPPSSALWLGVVAGLAGSVGLFLLYLSLARGVMGVAAPLTAVAAGGIPLLVGLLTEGLPGAPQLAGFALALAAIWVIAQPGGAGRLRPGDLWLPLLAGVGFGIFLALMGRLPDDVGFAWPLVVGRVASVALMTVVLLASQRAVAERPIEGGRRTTDDGRPRLVVGGRWSVVERWRGFPWWLAAVAGVGDTAGNAFFILSSQLGRLDVAAVLSALYPAATVALARVLLGERLTRRQNVGVGLALLAVLLIAV